MRVKAMKGMQVQLDFDSWKKLQEYKNRITTTDNRVKLNQLLKQAVNESVERWEAMK